MTKDLDEKVLKKNFNHSNGYWSCDEIFRLMIRRGVYLYEYMNSSEKFREIKLPPKHA